MKKNEHNPGQFSLLKLARWTVSYRFADEAVREPFAKLFCYAINELCAPFPVWEEVVKTLRVALSPAELSGKTAAKRWAKAVRKSYRVNQKLFAPRRSYKCLLIAQVCRVYALFNQKPQDKALGAVCSLLRISKNAKNSIRENAGNYADPLWMLNARYIKRWKWLAETITPFASFAQKEAAYYRLPRRNVTVFATMSAGKSTMINALLGKDYLPSKNEACTAKIAAISDIDHIGYCLGYAVKKGGQLFCGDITREQLEEWNCGGDVSEIVIEGNLDKISAGKVVTVIHDTPGVNYSGNPEHKKMTLSHLVESKPDAVICLLDATQMFITDFAEALDSLKKALKGGPARVLFVINKADSFDPEKESLKKAVAGAAAEIEKRGFENPAVIPVSSKAARLFKMALNGNASGFTENEIDDFVRFFRFFSRPEHNFNAAGAGIPGASNLNAGYPGKGTSKIVIEGTEYGREQVTQALFNTGITLVENILNTHEEYAK